MTNDQTATLPPGAETARLRTRSRRSRTLHVPERRSGGSPAGFEGQGLEAYDWTSEDSGGPPP